MLRSTAGRPSKLCAVFLKALEKAELRQIRFHDLRHTYASLRAAKGDNLQDVSKQSGHHSVKFTHDARTLIGCPEEVSLRLMGWTLRKHPLAPPLHPKGHLTKK